MQYIPLKTILGDYTLNSGNKEELDEDAILQWASDFIDMMSVYSQYRLNISMLNINNFKAKLPNDFKYVDMVLFSHETECGKAKLGLELSEIVYPLYGEDCKVKVTKECQCCDSITVDASEDIQSQFPWIGYSRVVATSAEFREKYFSKFFSIGSSHRATTNKILGNKTDIIDYSITYKIEGDTLYTSAKEGTIVLFYLGKMIDDEGYPMILDNIFYIKAMTAYIERMFAFRDYSSKKTSESRTYFADMEQIFNKAFEMAKTKINTPTFAEAIEIDSVTRSIIPKTSFTGNNIDYYTSKQRMYAGSRKHPRTNRYR